jgi:phage baseplate assembly protein W
VTVSPHFSLPLRFNRNTFVVSEQDSEEEILDCIELILRYTHGDRPEKPTFGLPDQTFASPNPNEDLIRASLAEWEERVGTEIGHTILDKLNPLIQSISVEVVNE